MSPNVSLTLSLMASDKSSMLSRLLPGLPAVLTMMLLLLSLLPSLLPPTLLPLLLLLLLVEANLHSTAALLLLLRTHPGTITEDLNTLLQLTEGAGLGARCVTSVLLLLLLCELKQAVPSALGCAVHRRSCMIRLRPVYDVRNSCGCAVGARTAAGATHSAGDSKQLTTTCSCIEYTRVGHVCTLAFARALGR